MRLPRAAAAVATSVAVVAVVALALAHAAAGHACIHDDLHQQKLAKHGDAFFNHPPTHVRYVGHETAAPGRRALLDFARGPLRFKVDFSAMTGDARTCYSSSGTVAVGVPVSSTDICQTNAQDNCYIECSADNQLTTAKSEHITNVLIPAAIDYLTSALDVIRVDGPLKVTTGSGECDIRDPVSIPAEYLDSGAGAANTDIILLVTGRPTAGTLLAYAGACRVDQYKRPIMAHINFGPGSLTPASTASSMELGTAIHELTHGLGFTASGLTGFSNFLNLADNSTRPVSEVIGKTVTVGSTDTYSYSAINTSRALTEARAHFGCNTLEGVPLEQQGGTGTATSHWEKRVFWNELMTGTSSADPRVSRITLGLLEDSGWYTANMDKAQEFNYGKGQGCSFISNKCTTGSWPANYICSENNARGCNFDRSARSQCQIVSYNAPDPPTSMSYFSDPRLGGGDQLADFCPLYVEFSNGVCTDTSNADTTNDPFFAQVFSRESVCIDSSIGLASGSTNIRCYRSGCAAANRALIQVGAAWSTCAGGETGLSSPGFAGTWSCPDAAWVSSKCAAVSGFPTVTSVSPSSIGTAGGETVTLTGTGFASDMYVALGPLSCNNVNLLSSTEATCVVVPPTYPTSIQEGFGAVPRTVVVIRADRAAGALDSGITVSFPSSALASVPSPVLALAALLAVVAAVILHA